MIPNSKKSEVLFLTFSSNTFWQHFISEFNVASAPTRNEFFWLFPCGWIIVQRSNTLGSPGRSTKTTTNGYGNLDLEEVGLRNGNADWEWESKSECLYQA
jgi:hypothetical protein